MVFQYWGKIGGLVSHRGPGPNVKWFLVFHADRSGRIQWNTNAPRCFVGGHEPVWQVFNNSGDTGCQGNQPVGPYLTEGVADNQWHRFTYMYKANSAPGARDGIARMWIDGTKIIDVSISAVGITPPGGVKTWSELDDLDGIEDADGTSKLTWGSIQTQHATPPWNLDIDDFTWWILN